MNILTYPKCGLVDHRARVERVLLLACYQRYGVPSVVEMIEYIQRLSDFPVTVLNLYEHRTPDQFLSLPPGYDLSAFSCVIIHNTVSYNPDNLYALDRYLTIKLSEYKGVKILFKQDDHYRFKETAQYIKSRRIDAVFTLMPEGETDKVYGLQSHESEIDVVHMLAGYVTPQMRQVPATGDRRIDIGYRGSIMPLSFGRLCFEKRKIGDDVERILSSRTDLKLDISSKWEDRLGGAQWSKFLRECKSVLGVESGSGIFDLDGNLSERCADIENQIGAFRMDHEYAEQYLEKLSDLEGNVKYFMISPRHFEAIASGTLQILFSGNYTGRMISNRHYLELHRDYSNLDELVDKVLDPKIRREYVERAFEEVVLDKKNWIEGFVAQLDGVIGKHLSRTAYASNRKLFSISEFEVRNLLLMQAHEHGSDPRRDQWVPRNSGPLMNIHQLVISRDLDAATITTTDYGTSIYSLPYKPWRLNSFHEYSRQLGFSNHLSSFLAFLQHLSTLSDHEISLALGAASNSHRIPQIRWYIDYILSTTATLLDGLRCIRGYDVIIAINLPTLFAAALAKQLWGVRIVYEALEYWPEADPDSEQFEIDFWTELEGFALNYVDYCNTVSPGLASLMREKYQKEFAVVPNCCPLEEGLRQPFSIDNNSSVRFIFQGSFAPHRGLEELIDAFASEEVNARLCLRGNDNSYKLSLEALASRLGVLGSKVFFLPAVRPSELVSAARKDGDVGVVPYLAYGENYKNCSPNKLGQFFAAHLPILANRTDFVATTVEDSGAGLVVEFSKRERLIEAIRLLSSNRAKLIEYSNNAKCYFERYYNWENLSTQFYKELRALSRSPIQAEFAIYPAVKKCLFDDIGEGKAVYISKRSAVVYHGILRKVWYKLPACVRNLFRPVKEIWINWIINLRDR